MKPRPARAFSLVEILVVVGILALLAGLLLVGLRFASVSAANRSTRALLEANVSILNEFENVRKLDNLQTAAGGSRAPIGSVAISGPARDDGMVSLASAMLNRFRSSPAASPLIDKLPTQSLTNWQALVPGVPPAWSNGVAYLPGDRAFSGGDAFVCLEGHTAAAGNNDPGNDKYWALEVALSPVVLDAWNAPIILVPGDGLRLFSDNGTPANPADDGPAIQTIRSSSRRPFFASAGPDGVFQGSGPDSAAVLKGAEDNLYSFEN